MRKAGHIDPQPWREELVEDGVNGLLVPVDDVAAMTDALAQLAGDRTLASTGGRWPRHMGGKPVTGEGNG